MLDKFIALLGFSAYWTAVPLLALTVFGILFHYIYKPALEEIGPDRDRLLETLRRGGGRRMTYVAMITRLLDGLDTLLGDRGLVQPRIGGWLEMRHPARFWTAQSFDRLAFVALGYPLASLWGGWLWFGDAGSIGAVFGLIEGLHGIWWAAHFVVMLYWSLLCGGFCQHQKYVELLI